MLNNLDFLLDLHEEGLKKAAAQSCDQICVLEVPEAVHLCFGRSKMDWREARIPIGSL